MPTWLIIFRPRTGDLMRFEQYEDSQEALRERFKAERVLGGEPGLVIVTISADSLETLKKYHSRFFVKSDAAVYEMSRLGQEIEASPPGIVTSGEGSNNPARG